MSEKKEEKSERLAAIERKAIKLYKAIDTLTDLDDGKTKAITECLTLLNGQLAALEKASAAIVAEKFQSLKKLYAKGSK